MQANVFDTAAKGAGTIDLDDTIFGIEPNVAVMHQAFLRQRANARLGTSNTLTRGLVSGGGRKPWRQKGTGRARQGSTRSPQWRGGGVVFGPHPRSYRQDMPKKMRRLAIFSASSSASAGPSPVPTPSRISRPRPICPTTRLSTVTDASVTRWMTARIA